MSNTINKQTQINEEVVRASEPGRSPEESVPESSQVALVRPANEGVGTESVGPDQTYPLSVSATVCEPSQSAPVALATEGVELETQVSVQLPILVEGATVSETLRPAPSTLVALGAVPRSGPTVQTQITDPRVQIFTAEVLRMQASSDAVPKRPRERVSIEETMPKRSKVGVKAQTREMSVVRKSYGAGRRPITVDANEIRSRVNVELEDLIGENCRTNVHFTIEEVTRLNDYIKNAGNIRGDITRSGLSLLVLVRHAEELWKSLRTKYTALESEADTEKAKRLLLEERVKALEDHNASHTLMEVDQVPMSEFTALREQNTLLLAKVEELTKTIAEHVPATPDNPHGEVALMSEIESLRDENSALRAEVAALRESISSASLPNTRANPTETAGPSKRQQECTTQSSDLNSQKDSVAKKEKLNSKKKRKSKRPKVPTELKNSATGMEKSPGRPSSETSASDVITQGKNPDIIDDEGYTRVQRKKPRKPKTRTKSEAVVIKANEAEYADILRKLRLDPTLEQLGRETKMVRRTRQNELLLILNKGAKQASHVYARLVKEAVGDGATSVRSLGAETTIQCKNLDETVTAEVLLEAIKTQCDTGNLTTSVHLKRYNQGMQTATFQLPAKIAALVLKVGKLKVNWSVCPVSVFERPAMCFRCLGYGHKSWDCKGPDRSKLCRRCGVEGHKASACKATPNCLICPSENNNHATGAPVCPCYRSALQQLKQCR